jgi:hypothetical protein
MFLVDGSPTGLIIAEIVNWTGKAIVVPRASLPVFLKRKEAQNAGVYILSGQDPDDPFRSRIYVGESETVGPRLRQHDSDEQKDFFDRAIVFVSKDENLTKAHARHLEEQLTERIKEAGRTAPMHGKAPGGAALPEADISDMDFFLDQIEVVLPVLGLDVLRPVAVAQSHSTQSAQDSGVIAPTTNIQYFVFESGAAKAKGVEIEGEFIVKAQSIARAEEAPSLPPTYQALRRQLIADGALQPEDDHTLLFVRDVPFSSPTAAACVVYGASISGPRNWILEGGSETYAEMRQRALQLADTISETE